MSTELPWSTRTLVDLVLLVVEVVEVVVCEGYGRHAASVMGMGNVVD